MADLGTPSAPLGAAIVAQVDASIGTDWRAGVALADVATSGAYGDLSGLPTLGTAAPLNVAAAGDAAAGEVVKGDDTRLSDARTPTAHTHTKSEITDFSDGDYATAAQGALADTATQPGDLATVATSGAYGDLSGLPTLGTAADNDEGDFASAAAAVPVGGTAGQILSKIDGTDYNTEWVNAPSGGGGGAVDSVNGQTGVVTLDADDIDDTSTAHKFATATQLSNADSAVQPGDLSAVATTGNYTDLTNRPNLATVAISGDYDDLVNKPATDAETILSTAAALAFASASNA